MCLIGRAASKLFEKKGYLETSLRNISAAAKLRKGSIYYYFSNKHEILYFVLDNYMDLQLGGLEDELKEMADSASKIQFIMFRHLNFIIKMYPMPKRCSLMTIVYHKNISKSLP
jgi:AcrR family transcriptional regulator